MDKEILNYAIQLTCALISSNKIEKDQIPETIKSFYEKVKKTQAEIEQAEKEKQPKREISGAKVLP